jgi:tetratricopeptide (TPR) repeat protein
MKFICNNCGFSAEVPDRRTTCPMCASDNVSVVSVTEQLATPEKPVEKKETDPVLKEKEEQPVDKNQEKKGRGPTERITLNDEFFSSKPDREQQEIANIIKELYPEAEEKGRAGFKMPDRKVLIGGAVAAVVLIIVVLIFALSPDDESSEDTVTVANDAEEKTPAVPDEEDIENIDEENIEPIYKKEIVKPAENVEKNIVQEKKVVVEEKKVIVEEQAVASQKKEVRKQQPKVVKKAETVRPQNDSKGSFDSYIKAGHKALADKKYTDALHEYKNASRINPTNGPVYKFLGIAYAYLQNQKQACVNYKKYIQYSPDAPDKAQVEAFLKACQ